MPLLSARLLIPTALVVIAWGGAHWLTSRDVAISPVNWPASASSVAPTPAAIPAAPSPSAASSPAPTGGATQTVPILPGALQQLNGDTRDTAIGLYAVIQQVEGALRAHLEQLVQQLEPGR